MIYSEIFKWQSIPGFSSHPIWRKAFEWLEKSNALLDNSPGRFTVLFPGETHMPKLKTSSASAVHKGVIKIPAHLLFDPD